MSEPGAGGAFRFWRGWLILAAGSQIPFGLGLAFPGLDRVLPFYHRAMCRALWGAETVPDAARVLHDWLLAVLGATLAGWGLLLAWIAWVPLGRRERWAWNAAAASLAIWFLPDTAMSAFHGVWPNVWFNLAALVALGLPLAALRRETRAA